MTVILTLCLLVAGLLVIVGASGPAKKLAYVVLGVVLIVTLARFFGTHVWVLPATLALLVGGHLYLVIKIGISAVPKKGE